MTRRAIATIHFNTDRYGSRHRTGAFDLAEFAKLTQDFDRFLKAPAANPMPCCYVIYSSSNSPEGEELRLFLNEVERIERAE